jgi:hypothetical protein
VRAVHALGLSDDSPEWVVVREKMISVLVIAVAQILGLVAVVLSLAFDTPRPEPVRSVILWAVLTWPAALGLLSLNAEVAARKELTALNGPNSVIPPKEET